MNTFQTYDLFRLLNFKKRKHTIEFGETDSLVYYRFDEVDYFNYVLIKSFPIAKREFIDILSIYVNNKRKVVKFIFPIKYKTKVQSLIGLDSFFHEIICVEKFVLKKEVSKISYQYLLPVKTETNILLYTKLYLEGFNSNKTNVKDVAKNFKLLLDTGKVDLFLIINNSKIAGVCSNFYNDDKVFLCACTVLEAHRNIGLQKAAIKERIEIGINKGYFRFTSWAYANSLSHQNLIKSGFSNYANYGECLSKPLENIISTEGKL